MDFAISTRMQDVLGRMRVFVEQELYPLEPAVAERGFNGMKAELREKREKVKTLGFWCPQIAKEHGGMGLSLMEHGMVSEVLGRSPLGHYSFNCQAPDAGNMEILIKFGTPEQKKQLLEPLVKGEIRSCFSMTEPDRPGSNPVWMETTAVKDGDDYVINGHKWFTSSADGADVRHRHGGHRSRCPAARASQPDYRAAEDARFQFVRNIPIMGHAGDDYDSHAEIRYENCRVPQSNLLGAEGAGFLIAQERLGPGRIHHCMRWIGICERSFELMCRRAAEREIAPGKPLGTKQTVQDWIAESRAEIDAARLVVLHAAWKIDKDGMLAARSEVSCIKFFCRRRDAQGDRPRDSGSRRARRYQRYAHWRPSCETNGEHGSTTAPTKFTNTSSPDRCSRDTDSN